MSKNKNINVISKLLACEGFSPHTATEIHSYGRRKHGTKYQKKRFARTKTAFSKMVKEKLDTADKLLLGQYIHLLCKINFDEGLRLGLLTTVSDICTGKESEQSEQ